jgi:hypothetical protein
MIGMRLAFPAADSDGTTVNGVGEGDAVPPHDATISTDESTMPADRCIAHSPRRVSALRRLIAISVAVDYSPTRRR